MINIINILRTILTILRNIWNLIETIAEYIVIGINEIGIAVRYTLTLINSLPYWIKSFAAGAIIIIVIYRIIGWSSGDSE